jgi:glycosyltransferase involved in cell wall biosynthesis
MNVAVFTDNDFDKVNGVTTTLTAALQYAPPDVRPRIYTAASLGVDQPHYLALPSLGMPIPFYREMRMYVPRPFTYLECARKDWIDVVHLTTPGPVGLAAMYVARQLHVPLVGSFHTDLAAYTEILSGSRRLGALVRVYMRWPYGRCVRVLVPSEHTRAMLMGANGGAARIDVWPRGVDTMLFTPARRSAQLRERWHVGDRRPAILYVGRLSREKGLAVLPSVQRRLHARGIEHRLVLVGEGPMMAELKRLLPDAIFTGILSRAAVAEAFASADLFLFPSLTDTAGNVVLEAQASGLPVVVSDVGGPRENIVEGRTGVVCESADAQTWADAIEAILRDPARRRTMGEAARTYALSRRWEHALQPLYRTYREVTGRHALPLQGRDIA